MADDLDVLTFEEAKAAVHLSPSRAGEEYVVNGLEQAVTAISRLLDDLCGPIVIREVTETVTPIADTILLTHWPVDAITSVTEYVSGTGTVLTAETTTTEGDYLLDERIGKLTRQSSWSTVKWLGRTTVVYDAGRYESTGTVDEKFKRAATEILQGNWSKYAAVWSRGGDPVADPLFFDEVTQVVNRLLWAERQA